MFCCILRGLGVTIYLFCYELKFDNFEAKISVRHSEATNFIQVDLQAGVQLALVMLVLSDQTSCPS